MKTLNRRDFPGAHYPERIIQFGEGNFLRAFVDWQVDLLNEHTDLNSGVVTQYSGWPLHDNHSWSE